MVDLPTPGRIRKMGIWRRVRRLRTPINNIGREMDCGGSTDSSWKFGNIGWSCGNFGTRGSTAIIKNSVGGTPLSHGSGTESAI